MFAIAFDLASVGAIRHSIHRHNPSRKPANAEARIHAAEPLARSALRVSLIRPKGQNNLI